MANAPAILRIRDLTSVRQCLTVFNKAVADTFLDASALRFIDPAAMVLLHQLAGRHPDGEPVVVLMPEQKGARDYFELHMGKTNDAGELKYKSHTGYPLRYIKTESRVLDELRAWRGQIQKLGALSEERARRLGRTLSEVLSNSFAHGAKEGSCIVAGQTFSKKQHTMIASIDSGDTIAHTLRASGRYDVDGESDELLIAMALEKGVTARSRPSNRGLGLYMLNRGVQDAGGTLIIVSGSGAVVSTRHGGVKPHALGASYAALHGTFIVVDLPIEEA